jgi:4-hydroxy-3-polyprenylbenzoate decarboxylase
MAYRDLHAFLERLAELGELHRVRAEVDPALEIAEITDRVSKAPGGAALFFDRVKGSPFPVVTNIFGSVRRVCAALEIGEPAELTRRLATLLGQPAAGAPPAGLAALADLPGFSPFAPVAVADGICQEVVDPAPDLAALPVLRNWAGDGRPGHDGRFITLPLVFTRDPETGRANCGMYRVEPFDGKSAGIHWRKTSGGAGHYRKYLERGERMPVAVALGGDPAVILAASLPLPEELDEMHFAGFLRREPVELVRCRTSAIMVPANAELVLEGFLEPGEERLGGTFGNHTGFYAAPQNVPVMHLNCITRRREAVYPTTVVGPPPMEDCYLAKAAERLLLPLIRSDLPEIAELNMPLEGIFHGCAMVAMAKRHPGHPREVAEALWAKGWLGDARLLVMVDAAVDVHDLSTVAWKVLNAVDWRRDLIVPGPAQDNTSLGRLALDATRKPKGEGGRERWPEDVARDQEILRRVDARWREYGFE